MLLLSFIGNPQGSQQPENALATLLLLIQSAWATKRLMTAPRGKTYFNERPRGRGKEFLARKIGEAGESKREGEQVGETVEKPAGRVETGQHSGVGPDAG